MTPSLIAATLMILASGQDQATPTPAATPPLTEPLTWETLPDALREQVEVMTAKPVAQIAISVESAATTDPEPRTVDHGDIILEQTVRPAAFATITTPARNARRYGPAGAVLSKAVDDGQDWWCWRDDRNFPRRSGPTDLYCYRDTDGDSDFDLARRYVGGANGVVAQSRYQFRGPGREEALHDAIGYRLEPDMPFEPRFIEKVVVRYDGPQQARIAGDGRLVDGEIAFHLLTGHGSAPPPGRVRGSGLLQVLPDAPDDGLSELGLLAVRLDAEGKGRLADPRGFVIEVERANSDGTAIVRLTSGLPVGETLLFPAPTRGSVLEIINDLRAEVVEAGAAQP